LYNNLNKKINNMLIFSSLKNRFDCWLYKKFDKYYNRELKINFGFSVEDWKNSLNAISVPWEDQIAINLSDNINHNNLNPPYHYKNQQSNIKTSELSTDNPIDFFINNDNAPLPNTTDREGYHGDNHYQYWLSGLKDYIDIKNALGDYLIDFKPGYSVFDFGCASGRVIRHFASHENDLELWASDINSAHVNWVQKYLNQKICVFQNSSIPYLPLKDSSIDLLYAFSVFSHIDIFETFWLLEIKRILKPNGIAYLSIHSDHTWEIMNENMPIYHALLSTKDFDKKLLLTKLKEDKVVFRYRSDGSYNSNVFYKNSYIKSEWGKIFDILDIVKSGHGYQDVVILQNK
jgi:ubiquinone/menaquinone biosynthesis C-methylase UbiE